MGGLRRVRWFFCNIVRSVSVEFFFFLGRGMVFYYVYNGFVKFLVVVIVVFKIDKDKFRDSSFFGVDF